jgi:hypothetical protein
LPRGFTQRLRASEEFQEHHLKVLVGEPRMPVAGKPSQIGSPHWIGLAGDTEVPADHVAGCCGDRGLMSGVLSSLAYLSAISDDTAAVEHPAEQVGHMPYLLLSRRPGQLEWLSRDSCHPDVTVGLDDVMPYQPGLVDDMGPSGSRPPPAREVSLTPVRGRVTEGPNPAEVDRCRILKSDGVTTIAGVGVDELDAVGQIAGLYL